MNVLILSDNPPPLGGAEQHMLLLESMFRRRGHSVSFFFFNEQAKRSSRSAVPGLLRDFLKGGGFDVAHVHAIEYYYAGCLEVLASAGIPVFNTLHDYRYLCPSGDFFRKGVICEDCRGGRFYRAGFNGCYSLFGAVGRWFGEKVLGRDVLNIGKVRRFIAPSLFLKGKYEDFGFAGKIEHVYNFLDLEPYREELPEDSERPYILFFGRLMPNKGLMTLADAVKGSGIRLKVAGVGPCGDLLRERIKSEKGLELVEIEGFLERRDLIRLIGGSRLVVVPSECYEVLGFTALESMALGRPVIGADIGGIPELVSGGRGVLFEPGDVEGLRGRIASLYNDRDARREIGQRGRSFVFENMGEDVYYEKIMRIYES